MALIVATPPSALGTIPPSTKVRIFRDSEEDIGYRECLITIDGVEFGNVEHRHVLELELGPGTHYIQATNRVRRTERVRFEAIPGKRITFQVANTGGAFYEFFAWMQLAVPRISLWIEQPDEYPGNLDKKMPECWNLY